MTMHAMGRLRLVDLPLGTGTACRRLPSSGTRILYQKVDIRLLIHVSLDADETVEIRRFLQFFITSVQDLVTTNRSADPSQMKLLRGKDLFESIIERWHLSNIAVHPSYQHHGIAGQLTKWGLKIASESEATINAEPVYRHIGFRDYSYNYLARDIDGQHSYGNRRG